MPILYDISELEVDNDSSAKNLFYWRGRYESASDLYGSIDLLYEDVFYGRINKDGVAVYPSESALKQLIATKTIYSINFVANAWENFRTHVDRSVASGKISRDSIYTNLEPQSGWRSIHTAYNEWNNDLYQLFSGEFMNPTYDQKIVDFRGYIDVYLEFVNRLSRFFPYTRESYILSRMCSPTISGLIIEIADLPHDAAAAKRMYLDDDSYGVIVNIAKKYGFRLDKNAPWRFIADLDSVVLQEYMKEYSLTNTAESAIKQTYHTSYEYDLEAFKYYVWAWYDQYTLNSPHVDKVLSVKSSQSEVQELFKFKECGDKTITLKTKREVLTRDQAFEKFSDEFWVRLYAYVRAKEAQKRWRQPKFDKVVKKTLDLMRIKGDNDAAMEYLYGEIETPGKKQLELKKSFTKEQIDGILIEKGLDKRKATFNF